MPSPALFSTFACCFRPAAIFLEKPVQVPIRNHYFYFLVQKKTISMHLVVNYRPIGRKLIFASARENFFFVQHHHPIRHIHCQVTAFELLSVFYKNNMLRGLPDLAKENYPKL